MTKIDIENLFDKYLYVTTTNEEKYKIEKKKIYINGSSSFYGKKYIVTSDKLNNKNLYILKNIYSLEDNRLRFCYEEYPNAKLVNTIEKYDDNSEKRILVIEKYDDKKTLIGSIGNIKRIDSDKLDEINERKRRKSGKLRLILKPDIDRNESYNSIAA